MISHVNLENVLILDIETVSSVPDFNRLPENLQLLWNKKNGKSRLEEEAPADHYLRHAGIHAEFGKIICISVGKYVQDKESNTLKFRIKSFCGHDEKQILNGFIDLLNNHFNDPQKFLLCGHNSKEFDFPYLGRRILVNDLHLPELLKINGKKPWEVNHLDTMQLWKFGDYKSYTSLDLLAAIFDIPTPKDDIDGSMVNNIYWNEQDMDRITTYCQKDVLTVAQLLLKFKRLPLLKEEHVIYSA